MKTGDLLYGDETRAIIGCVYDVFNGLPRFAEEALYQEAMEIALEDAGIPFEAQKDVHPSFHGRNLAHTYRPDIICFGRIIVELKAVSQLIPAHYGQLRNYMGLLGMKVGLLVNFHATPVVEIRRLYLRDMELKGEVSSLDASGRSVQEAELVTDAHSIPTERWRGGVHPCISPAPRSGDPAGEMPDVPATLRPGNRPPSSPAKRAVM